MFILSLIPDRNAAVSAYVIERTARRMKQFFKKKLKDADSGITIDQWVVIQALSQADGSFQRDIAQAVDKDRPTLTRILDLLEKKGIIEREADEVDRRHFRIYLTDLGRDTIRKTYPVIQESRAQAWDGLSQAEMDQLVKLLNRVIENVA